MNVLVYILSFIGISVLANGFTYVQSYLMYSLKGGGSILSYLSKKRKLNKLYFKSLSVSRVTKPHSSHIIMEMTSFFIYFFL